MARDIRKGLKKLSVGTFFVTIVATLPLWLFGVWIKDIVSTYAYTEKSGVESVDNSLSEYYQLCDQSESEVKIEEIEKGLVPELIKIDKARINHSIVSVPLKQGTWKVYDGVANYAEETSLINTNGGNIGIYGHDKEEVFSSIKILQTGDVIELYSGNYKAIYKVVESKVSDPQNVSVFYETENPTVTLVTCDGRFSQQRYVIQAEFDKIVELNCMN